MLRVGATATARPPVGENRASYRARGGEQLEEEGAAPSRASWSGSRSMTVPRWRAERGIRARGRDDHGKVGEAARAISNRRRSRDAAIRPLQSESDCDVSDSPIYAV